jgi:hypothetical protein
MQAPHYESRAICRDVVLGPIEVQGFNFFMFGPDSDIATEVALPNECVECHQRDGAYDGVFVQFYPDMQRYLPAEVQERLKQKPSAH